MDSEQCNRGCGWPVYVAVGFGVIVLICVFSFVLIARNIGDQMAKQMKVCLNPTPVVATRPYSFRYETSAAKTAIVLPNGQGRLFYMQSLDSNSSPCNRAIKLVSSKGNHREWPLPSANLPDINVKVYWYPAKNGDGPFLSFQDESAHSFLDFQKHDIGDICSLDGQTFIGYYGYNDKTFVSGVMCQSVVGSKTVQACVASGKPGRDVTAFMAVSRKIYLGSIVSSGKKIVFVPAKNKQQP